MQELQADRSRLQAAVVKSSRSADPSARPRADGKFLRVGGRRFWIRGVTYGTFLPNSRGELFPEPEVARRDLRQIAATGANTVRTYTTPPLWFLDLAAEHGLMVVAGVFWEGRQCLFEDRKAIQAVETEVAVEVERIAGHPALLMVCLGNEIPPQIARWHGKRNVERVLRRLRDRVKAIDPDLLVTYSSYPPTEFLDLSFLDVIAFNVYLEREPEFRAYLARLQMLAGDRPLFLSELGLDSRRSGLEKQAEVLDWQLRCVWEAGLAGAAVYAWTDEWAVGGVPVEDWDFGLVDRQRRPKPALDAVAWNYQRSRYDLRSGDWPLVSVVCCAYDAGPTVAETLESLERLNYPNYEVIVVDDGSRDATAAIAAEYGCRLIRVQNGGLSRARNIGIEAAAGEIVAFIDSDAAADPDWLYFLVTRMEASGAAGCGGPNLPPPGDPEPAQQVALAPGNPVHVLVDNETAEHLPGCNVAFRKSALQEAGCFDPVYRTAGDDVDVCWKVLERGGTLAFSPAAIVWHHRRGDLPAYLRQQLGYGMAEALLEAHYPERYGISGGARWRGHVYEGPQTAVPLSFALRRERVYHGAYGSALFQSVYSPGAPWWFSLLAGPSVHAFNGSLAATGATLAAAGNDLWPVPAGVAAAGVLAAVACCVDAAVRACRLDGSPRVIWRRAAGVALLHFLQPWARWRGRLRGERFSRRKLPWPRRAEGRLWAGWDRREEWLEKLRSLLEQAGMAVHPGDPWGRADLVIRSYPGYTARLESVVERQTEIRFRARIESPWRVRALELACLAAAAGTLAAPPLLPLALPFLAVYAALRKEKRRLAAAVALVGRRAGEHLGMVALED